MFALFVITYLMTAGLLYTAYRVRGERLGSIIKGGLDKILDEELEIMFLAFFAVIFITAFSLAPLLNIIVGFAALGSASERKSVRQVIAAFKRGVQDV